MRALRKEEITLFCEDSASAGRTARLFNAAVQELKKAPDLGFAEKIAVLGSASKSDVHVWTKFARSQSYRAMGVRDRDFLLETMVRQDRAGAFHESHERVRPWPLPRRCIESYLLDADVVSVVLPKLDGSILSEIIGRATEARMWLDVARGAMEDFLYRWRRVGRSSITGHPVDRPSAVLAACETADVIRREAGITGRDELLEKHLDALAADMVSDGPLRHRVDGKELLADVQRSLSEEHPASLPRGGLLSALERQAQKQPPASLLADLRALLLAVPERWRVV